MKFPYFRCLFFAFMAPVLLAESPSDIEAPWLASRSMENFQVLLDRSPFSLPTAEESAPIADRFFLTGAATINEEPVVFVLDKNTQIRHMLGKKEKEDPTSNQLFEYTPAPDPKNMTALVQIEGQKVSIRYMEFGAEPQQMPQPPVNMNLPQQQKVGMNQPPPNSGGGRPPGAVQPGGDAQNPRRVIRRRVIAGQPPVAQPVPNQ
jgi:hypothetical protein